MKKVSLNKMKKVSLNKFMARLLGSAYKYVTKPNPKVKAQWLDDLRNNPKYSNQGQGKLKVRKPHCKTEYCCLGVLADRIAGTSSIDVNSISIDNVTVYQFNGRPDLIPSEIRVSIGLSNIVQMALASANDAGYTFAEIADWIEENV